MSTEQFKTARVLKVSAERLKLVLKDRGNIVFKIEIRMSVLKAGLEINELV